MEVAGPLGTPLGLAQRKRASPRGEAGTSGLARHGVSREVPCSALKGETVIDSLPARQGTHVSMRMAKGSWSSLSSHGKWTLKSSPARRVPSRGTPRVPAPCLDIPAGHDLPCRLDLQDSSGRGTCPQGCRHPFPHPASSLCRRGTEAQIGAGSAPGHNGNSRLKLLPVFPPPPTDGKGGMERKPLSGKGLKRPGRLAAGKAEDRLASPPGPAGPLADLAFPSVRTQLGLWDFTSRRRHIFPLGAVELAGPLGITLGLAQWKRASSRGQAGSPVRLG